MKVKLLDYTINEILNLALYIPISAGKIKIKYLFKNNEDSITAYYRELEFIKNLFLIGIFRITELFFKQIYDLSLSIIVKPRNRPFWYLIFFLPISRDTFFIQPRKMSELFYTQIALFKSLFETLVIHYSTFKK